MLAAAAALASLGMATAPQAPAAQQQVPTVREYIRTEKQTRRTTRRQEEKRKRRGKHRAEAVLGQPWKKFKGGWMTDGRGDIRSPKRLFRQAMESRFGKLSGRQWTKLRKSLRRAERAA